MIGLPVVLIAITAWVIMSEFKVDGHYEQPVKSLKVAQLADVHYGYPVKDKPLPKVEQSFHLFDSFTRYRIPVAQHFDSPMGAESGAFTYNAQAYLVDNKKRGFHLGDDLNGIGGQDTDILQPVYAAADGLVVYSAKPSDGWGNVLIIAHRLRDGRLVQTFYSHLFHASARVGDLVARGQEIGTVGSSLGIYYSHLHYEIRESDGVHIGGGYVEDKKRPGETLDPTKFVAEYNKRKPEDIRKSPLKLMLEIDLQNRADVIKGQFISEGAKQMQK